MSSSMMFDIGARDSASSEFLQIAAAAERLEEKLRRLDGKTFEPKIDINVTAANRKLEQLNSRLRALQNVRARVDVDGAAEARREITALVVELRKIRDQRATLRINTGSARADIERISRAMREIRDSSTDVRVNYAGNLPDANELRRAARALRDLRDASTDVRVNFVGNLPNATELRNTASALRALSRLERINIHISVTGAVEALAQVRELREELRGFPRRTTTTINVDVDRGIAATSRLINGLTAISSASALAVAGAGAATAAVASLGGALASTAGVAPVAVAGLAGLGLVATTVKLGLTGIGDAFKAMGDPKKFAEALGKLSPEAKAFALAGQQVAPAWRAVRAAVQDDMFRGLNASLRDLSASYLPVAASGLRGISTELNLSAKGVANYAQQFPVLRDVGTIFDNVRASLTAARPAATNLFAAFVDISTVGSQSLPKLGAGVTGLTGRFREFIAEARRTGEMQQWIDNGAAALGKLGSIAGNVGSILGSVFQAAQASGADFLTTLDRGTESVARFMRSAEGQSSLTRFFTESRQAIDTLMPGLANLGRGIAEAVARFADTGGLTEFAAGLSNLASQIGAVLPGLGQLAGNALGALGNGLSLAASLLGPLVSGLVSLVNATGPVGPTVLAMVAAFAGLQRVSGWVTAAGASLAGFAGRMGASEGATSRFMSVVSRVGGAIPILGAAAVAAAAGWDAMTTSAEEAAAAIQQGGAAGAAAARDLATQSVIADVLKDKFGALGSIYGMVTTSTEEFAASLDEVGRAQLAASQAYSAYQTALASGDPGRVAQAQSELAAATDRVAAAQKNAENATKSASDRMREQVSAAQSLIGGHLQLEDSLARVAAAEKAANEARKGSPQQAQALRDYVAAADQAATSAQKLAEAQATAAGASDPAAAGARAYGATLLQLAATAQGPAQQALLGYIAKLDDATLASLSAGAEVSGFATKVLTLPDGRTVKIAVDPETGKVVEVKTMLDSLVDKTVVINGNPMPAMSALNMVLGAIALGQGTVNIDGNPIPVQDALSQVLAQVDLSTAMVTINGNSVPAQGVFEALRASIIAGSPTVDINGNPVPVQQVVAALLASTSGTPATVPINGEPSNAFGAIASVFATANTPATMPINGNPAGANAAAGGARAGASAPATMPINGNAAGANSAQAGARGQAQAPATMPIGGNASGAQSAQAGARSAASAPATMPIRGDASSARAAIASLPKVINAVYRVVRQLIGFADGGIYQPMADGGVLGATSTGMPVRAYAGGGRDYGSYDGHRLSPMASRAAKVPPRTWRVVGDNQRHTEVYIPLNGSKASLDFTGYAAAAQGYDLVPRSNPQGMSLPGPTLSMTTLAPAGRVDVASQVRAGLDQMRSRMVDGRIDVDSLVAELRSVRAAVIGQGPDGASDVVAELRSLRPLLADVGRANAAQVAQDRRAYGDLGRI